MFDYLFLCVSLCSLFVMEQLSPSVFLEDLSWQNKVPPSPCNTQLDAKTSYVALDKSLC